MKYLGENHVGFDKTELAFPSLSGCQAVVYQTERGLYGLHNYGGAEKLKWRGRSEAFKKSDDTTGAITSATEHLQMKLGPGEDANSEKAKYVTAAVFGKVTLNTPDTGWKTVYPELLRG